MWVLSSNVIWLKMNSVLVMIIRNCVATTLAFAELLQFLYLTSFFHGQLHRGWALKWSKWELNYGSLSFLMEKCPGFGWNRVFLQSLVLLTILDLGDKQCYHTDVLLAAKRCCAERRTSQLLVLPCSEELEVHKELGGNNQDSWPKGMSHTIWHHSGQ